MSDTANGIYPCNKTGAYMVKKTTKFAANIFGSIIPDRVQWELMSLPGVPYNGPELNEASLKEGGKIAHRIKISVKRRHEIGIDNEDVLEIGSGPGRIAVPMALSGANMYTTDISRGLLARCRSVADNYGVKITTKRSESGLPEFNTKFKLIYTFRVFQHIKKRDSVRYIFDSFEHLQSGGVLFITVPSLHTSRNQKQFCKSLADTSSFRMRYFTSSEMRIYLEMAGYEDITIMKNGNELDVSATKP